MWGHVVAASSRVPGCFATLAHTSSVRAGERCAPADVVYDTAAIGCCQGTAATRHAPPTKVARLGSLLRYHRLPSASGVYPPPNIAIATAQGQVRRFGDRASYNMMLLQRCMPCSITQIERLEVRREHPGMHLHGDIQPAHIPEDHQGAKPWLCSCQGRHTSDQAEAGPKALRICTRVGHAVADAVQQKRGAVAERRHREHSRQVTPQLAPGCHQQRAARHVRLTLTA